MALETRKSKRTSTSRPPSTPIQTLYKSFQSPQCLAPSLEEKKQRTIGKTEKKKERKKEKMANLHVISFLVLAVLSICSGKSALGEAAGCQGDFQSLKTQCARYVQKKGPRIDPSQSCCNVVRSVDVICACKYVTKEVEAAIDMGKVVHVAAFCDRPLPHGMKCGSYTVP